MTAETEIGTGPMLDASSATRGVTSSDSVQEAGALTQEAQTATTPMTLADATEEAETGMREETEEEALAVTDVAAGA